MCLRMGTAGGGGVLCISMLVCLLRFLGRTVLLQPVPLGKQVFFVVAEGLLQKKLLCICFFKLFCFSFCFFFFFFPALCLLSLWG